MEDFWSKICQQYANDTHKKGKTFIVSTVVVEDSLIPNFEKDVGWKTIERSRDGT